MNKPRFGKPRSISGGFSLSRILPRLQAPLSASKVPVSRPRPVVGKPGAPVAMRPPSLAAEPPQPVMVTAEGLACERCGHDEADHPVRYVCDKYPHPDPLQLCGCQSETLEEVCSTCGHKGRSHKPRHRCRATDCHCWGFEGSA